MKVHYLVDSVIYLSYNIVANFQKRLSVRCGQKVLKYEIIRSSEMALKSRLFYTYLDTTVFQHLSPNEELGRVQETRFKYLTKT